MQVLSNIDLDDVYHIRESIDLYLVDDNKIKFYNINTRNEIVLRVNQAIIDFLGQLDGKKTLKKCLPHGGVNHVGKDVYRFIEFLLKKKIIDKPDREDILEQSDILRFDRQIVYFDDFSHSAGGQESQNIILNTKVLIFGIGSIGGTIAVELARMGIRNFSIVDKGSLKKSDKQRHWYYTESMCNEPKVFALEKFLQRIDSTITVKKYEQEIFPQSNITQLFDGINIVINTMSTPYILYTSIKIEKECLEKHIPLYIAGGFDAHLGSTGELIFPPITPCVSCYANHYTQSLSNWKPNYNKPTHSKKNQKIENYERGGLSGLSLFSASFATLEILLLLLGKYKEIYRGEYDFQQVTIRYNKDIKRRESCHICNTNIN